MWPAGLAFAHEQLGTWVCSVYGPFFSNFRGSRAGFFLALLVGLTDLLTGAFCPPEEPQPFARLFGWRPCGCCCGWWGGGLLPDSCRRNPDGEEEEEDDDSDDAEDPMG